MSTKLDLVAVGSWSNFDHIFRVNRLPRSGDTVQIISPIERVETKTWGGCAPNNAAAAAHLGFSAGLVAVAGEDYKTSGYEHYLEQLGINQRGVIIVPGAACGHSFLFTDPEGQSICISHLGISERQTEFEPNAEVLQAARAVVLNYRFDAFTLKAGRMARQAGAQVIVSGALTTAPELGADFVSICDALFATKSEVGFLLDCLQLTQPAQLFARGVRAIFQTMGKTGCQVLTPEREVWVPAVAAQRLIDTTGAGDAFVGAAAACLGRGIDWTEAARVGATTASFVVEEWGCQTGLPTRDAFAQRYGATFGRSAPLINAS